MELDVAKETKTEMEFVLKGEDHTFSKLLVSTLLKDPNVDVAQYDIPHPLVGEPTFYLKVKKGSPRDALKKATSSLKADIKSLTKR
jgi:DNA-directed RNA polymerase subunit L